ncbi:MAG: aspartate 1-decarboxylase [Planctomycetota bacterium]|jgi:aspartate 1-decarboxylase
MFIKVLKSKLHRAIVTDVKLHYPGSIELDAELMEAAGIVKYESVLIADLDNGNRFETYAVPAETGSRRICVMGAAANLVKPKDILIIMAFGLYEPDEVKKAKPKIIVLDENNKIIQPSS